jgi:MSHA biogenesis protein MshI
LFFKRKHQPGWLAIVPASDHFDLVHVRRSATGRPEIVLCESYRTEGSDTNTLARLRKECKLDEYRCTTLLKFADYKMHSLDAPNVPVGELKNAVRWRMKDILDFPLEQATIDVLDVPVDANGQSRSHSVYAVAARNDVIERTIKSFNESNVPLEAIDVPALAQRNIASLFEPQGRGLAMLGFYDECCKLTISSGGELFLTRRIDITLSQLVEAEPDRRTELFDRIALELQRSLDGFDRQYSYVPVAKLMLAPLPKEIGLQQYLAANIYVPIEVIDLANALDFPAIPELRSPARQAQCLSIIGAALRGDEETSV